MVIKVAIVYHSRSGNVYRLATAARDAAIKAGAEPRLLKFPALPNPMVLDRQAYADLDSVTREMPEATLDDLIWADAIMIGTPVHFGLPAPEVVNFIDHTGPVAIPGKLVNKVVTVFTSGSTAHAGQQTTILAIHNSLCHWGSLIVPNGSSVEILGSEHNGSPYGTCSISGHRADNVHQDNLRAIEYQTLRLVEVATAYNAGLERITSSINYVTMEDLAGKFPWLSVT